MHFYIFYSLRVFIDPKRIQSNTLPVVGPHFLPQDTVSLKMCYRNLSKYWVTMAYNGDASRHVPRPFIVLQDATSTMPYFIIFHMLSWNISYIHKSQLCWDWNLQISVTWSHPVPSIMSYPDTSLATPNQQPLNSFGKRLPFLLRSNGDSAVREKLATKVATSKCHQHGVPVHKNGHRVVLNLKTPGTSLGGQHFITVAPLEKLEALDLKPVKMLHHTARPSIITSSRSPKPKEKCQFYKQTTFCLQVKEVSGTRNAPSMAACEDPSTEEYQLPAAWRKID